MTAAKLRSVTVSPGVSANSPVRFATTDGREVKYVGWHSPPTALGTDGKPAGPTTLVIVIDVGQDGDGDQADTPTEATHA